MKDRVFDINPDCEVELIKKLVYEDFDEIFENNRYDFVVDAIDVIGSKVNLIEYCVKNKINIISSMGFGNKMHPEMVENFKNKKYICLSNWLEQLEVF